MALPSPDSPINGVSSSVVDSVLSAIQIRDVIVGKNLRRKELC
jgi:hypothetical protein